MISHLAASRRIFAALCATAVLGAAMTGRAASFTFTDAQTAGASLGAGQTGDITSTGSLTVSSGNAIAVTGNNVTIINAGTINETKTSRDIRDSNAITGLVVTNTTGGIMETNDADVIQMQNRRKLDRHAE